MWGGGFSGHTPPNFFLGGGGSDFDQLFLIAH